ncbi:MAG: hypothetical protein AB7N65_26425 [Vicinamibacterales bacterium]
MRWGLGRCSFELRSADSGLLERAAVVFDPWRAETSDSVYAWRVSKSPEGWLISREDRRDGNAVVPIRADVGQVISAVEFRAVRALAEEAPDLLTFHAALVAWKEYGLLIVGPHEAGKSTLSCALWLQGFSFLGDDVAVVDPVSGMGQSGPRRVSLRPPSRELLGEAAWARMLAAPSSENAHKGYLFHPHEVDRRPRPESVKLAGCIFLARRTAGKSRAGEAAAIPGSEAALALLPYSNLARRPDLETAIARVSMLAARVPMYDLARGPLPGMITAIERVVRSA